MRKGQVLLTAIMTVALASLLGTSPARAGQTWHQCHVAELWDGTIDVPHYSVHCVEPLTIGATSIKTFVMPIADKERSTRLFNVAMAALLSGRLLGIMFESSEVNPVCSSFDCKTILYFGLVRQ